MPNHQLQIIALISVIALLFGIQLITKRYVSSILKRYKFGYQRRKVIVKIINLLISLVAIVLLSAILGIKRSELVVFISSVLTILGIAFFAQWSLLSNISASLILFFHHPVKLGDKIIVLDKDHPVEGRVSNITFFFIHVKNEQGQITTVPNNLVLQKSIQIIHEEEQHPE